MDHCNTTRGHVQAPSMKVPPKRKGNACRFHLLDSVGQPSMKVPPKRKGNAIVKEVRDDGTFPSMKVPPKRKGNSPPNHADLSAG